ncbi:MAG: Eco57I restriction-modification methylase domain-containing protein, partial [Candidatus Lokiarchaeota archaeon]|nr:Eco57I restriction-modification methylase domain-containing protein [Candidatus Lokiarchaeota archaeon]
KKINTMQNSKKYQKLSINSEFNNYFSYIHTLLKKNEIKKVKNAFSKLEDIETKFLNSYLTRKNEGVFFTSDKISRFIVKKTLISFLNNKINLGLKSFDQIIELDLRIKKKIGEILKKITICDPTCGSGVFLYNSAIIIYKLLKNIYPNSSNSDLKINIVKNIYGLDINPFSIDISKLKIYKWVLNDNFNNINDIYYEINKNFQVLNSLTTLDWPKSVFNKNQFDLIIGNPPYGNILNSEEKTFLEKVQTFSKDIYCAYLLKALEWSDGIIGFLVPKSFLLRQNYIDLRKSLFSKANILMIYDIGPNLFRKATNEVQILIYKNNLNKNENLEIFDYPNNKVTTYFNQNFDNLRICNYSQCQMSFKSKKFFIYTFQKKCPFCNSHTIELNRIRIKCNRNILELIDKIEKVGDLNYINIKDFPSFKRGEEARGLKEVKNLLVNNNNNNKGTCYFINAKQDFTHFYFHKNKLFDIEKINSKILKGEEYEFYKKPKLLIKHNNIYPEAIFTKDHTCFTSSIYSLIHPNDIELKYLCSMLNSIVLQFYCIFGINNQKGTTINLNQYMIRHLPIIKIQKNEKSNISERIDIIINNLDENNGKISQLIKSAIKEIDNKIFDIFSIDIDERKFMINKVKQFNQYFKLIY